MGATVDTALGIPATAVVSGAFLSGKASQVRKPRPPLTASVGAMMSISAFFVPVCLDTNTDAGQMLRQWARLYHYGHIYLPGLCITTCGLYFYAASSKINEASNQWQKYTFAAVLTAAMIPFTWLIMTPTNENLFELEASRSVPDLSHVRNLVVKWAWLHVTRSLFPLVGAMLGFTVLLQD
ncbi:hypothetical protein QQS21_007626 [Conoideocrella luteorostrata]|uniref:DUF1772-domain-containing protein n=1 Tax=Conoideocrella luteorostrata TaxID=1105319 RepID=A0AAJ0CKB6_9HYPO|nr:hypothetical protein QQS21_007626 [Conoideocrella luteorostrata]